MTKNVLKNAFSSYFLTPGFRIHKIIESGSNPDPDTHPWL
jgi:hypothetical protein